MVTASREASASVVVKPPTRCTAALTARPPPAATRPTAVQHAGASLAAGRLALPALDVDVPEEAQPLLHGGVAVHVVLLVVVVVVIACAVPSRAVPGVVQAARIGCSAGRRRQRRGGRCRRANRNGHSDRTGVRCQGRAAGWSSWWPWRLAAAGAHALDAA